MGGTNWSSSHYDDRVKMRCSTAAAKGMDVGDVAFAYNYDIKSGARAAAVHDLLNPKGVVFRESRDSETHPKAVPVAVLCDVTGSMQSVPRIVQENLKKLIGLLIRKGYLEHPAIMIGAIGDATCDAVPLQMGQYESGIEIEDCLTNLYLEGGGGGHITESYEQALYFMARHTVHDHWEKRGEKGYLFIIGDETPYDQVKKDEVERIIGDKLDQNVPVADIMKEVQERYHTYYILPKLTSNFGNKTVRECWRKLVGQNILLLEDPNAVCECIATQIGLMEGSINSPEDAEADLVAVGTDATTARHVSRALVPAGAEATKKGSVQKLPDSGGASGLATF